jgi:hypothetical protein
VAFTLVLVPFAACRDKRYTVRDFTFEASKFADEESRKSADSSEFSRLQQLLTK